MLRAQFLERAEGIQKKNCSHREQMIISQQFLGIFLLAPSEHCCWHCHTEPPPFCPVPQATAGEVSTAFFQQSWVLRTKISFTILFPPSSPTKPGIISRAKRLMGLCGFFSSRWVTSNRTENSHFSDSMHPKLKQKIPLSYSKNFISQNYFKVNHYFLAAI